MIVCGIDPAAAHKYTGVAYYHVEEKRFEAYTIGPGFEDQLKRADKFVIELPRIYPQGHQRPNDLIALAARAGYFAGKVAANGWDFQYVNPSDWKRQLSKEMCWNRVLTKLTHFEVLSLANIKSLPKAAHDDVRDAVGIALHGAGVRIFE